MPIPFAAFLPLIGQGINTVSNLLTNKAQKQTSLEFYDRQRADALSDWNRQNQYNSPSAQMQRYKEAGLSPHLIYGQTNTAPPVRSADAKTPNYTAPQFDAQSANPLLVAAQLENMRKQGNLMDAQALKAATEIDNKKLQTEFLADTYGYRMEGINQSNLLKGSQYRKTEEEITKTQGQIRLQKQQAQNIIANTNLSNERKAQVSQLIQNLITTNALLGEKVKTEQYQNEIQQKIQSFGVVGSTAAQLLRLIFGK